MDIPNTLWLIVDILLWLMLVLVHSLSVNFPAKSEFELVRLVESGDENAKHDLRRLDAYARLVTLQSLAETLLIIVISIVTVGTFGWLLGVLIAVVGIMQRDTLSRLSFLRTKAASWYVPREMRFIDLVGRWSWLDWFRGSSQPGGLPQFSSRAELEEVIKQSPALFHSDERARFIAGLHFDTKTIKDVMTPKAMIETAASDDIIGPLVLDELHKTGHSRFPVIRGDIDHVVGVLYLHDLVDLNHKKRTVNDAMRAPVHYIHEDQSLEHALHAFLRVSRHLFIVVNDYRETVGVVSLEDVLEALIGKKIVDEFDRFDDLRAVAESNPRKNNSPKGKKDI